MTAQPIISTDKGHALRNPSGIARRKLCPGSVVMERNQPDDTNKYSAEGTAAHTLALDLCLANGHRAEQYAGTVIDADGFTFTVGTEMINAVNDFIDYVLELVDPARGDILLLEQEVPIGWFTGEEGATGTADVVGITENGKRLVVIDLKYGQGVKVYGREKGDPIFEPDADGFDQITGYTPGVPNEQLVAYAGGALKDLELVYDEIENITLSIMQPRLEHVDEVELTVEELDYEIDRLSVIEKICDDAEREFDRLAAEGEVNDEIQGPGHGDWAAVWLAPGEKQCKFCKAARFMSCPALDREALNTVTSGAAEGDDFPDLTADPGALPKALAAAIPLPETLSGEALAARMRSLGLVEIWEKAIRAETERRLFAGEEVPGYGIFAGRQGNRAWSDAEEAERLLKAARLKSDEMYKRQVITPPQAEKVLKDKPRLWAKIQPLITRADGKPTVDTLDCGREPWVPVSGTSFPDVSVQEAELDPLLS